MRESLLCGEFAEVSLAPVVEASEAVSLARGSRLCQLIRPAFKMVLSPISQLFSVTGFQVIVPNLEPPACLQFEIVCLWNSVELII